MKSAILQSARLSILLLFLLLPSACQRTDKQTEALLHCTDSLLTADRPDSALRLLKEQIVPEELRRSHRARYALLLARATDKCELSLLPCDSLLDVALDYYDDDRQERAVALLYKGRLEIEMEQSEQAIGYLLEGLEIAKKFPQEVETRRHLLSSLGNEYYDAQLYEKAGKAYKELYECCFTSKDKAIALYSLSHDFLTSNKDSLIALKSKSFEYAKLSKDSTIIAMTALNLSFEYSEEETEKALHYAQLALEWLPGSRERSNYYASLGDIWLRKEEYDSASYYLNKSLEGNKNINEKAATLLSLAEIKKEQKDYQATTELLYQFIEIADSTYFNEQSTQIQQLIHQYDTKAKIKEEQARGQATLRTTIASFIFLCLLIALFYQHRISKRKRQQLINEQRLRQTQERIESLQTTIAESLRIVALLQKERSTLMYEKEQNDREIEEREAHIEQLKKEKQALRHWLFQQSPIYNKVLKLSKQKVSEKKELRVLTDSEQKMLMETALEIYADYTADLKAQYPKLTNEDLLYLCLDDNDLPLQTIALCFGNIDTHAIVQRKYRLKKRMTAEE